MPCLVGCYDCFRGCVSAKSIRTPCCCGKGADVHDVYYHQFLETGVGPSTSQLNSLKGELMAFIAKQNCGPILIRLAWHDSGTYDQRKKKFGEQGGAIGTIVFDGEMNFGANNGLPKAKKYLEAFKNKYPAIGWADLIQMASACAVEHMGGPKIAMKYGRRDGNVSDCAGSTSREGFGGNAGLPDAKPPFGCGSSNPADHLRAVFGKKMGFTDEEIVALSGAHTIGRAFADRSGTVMEKSGNGKGTEFTNQESMGMQGGKSWTKNWLKFDNEYFKVIKENNPSLACFPTDAVLVEDAGFKVYADKFAADNNAFMMSYAKAHKKLSELGSEFTPAHGVPLA